MAAEQLLSHQYRIEIQPHTAYSYSSCSQGNSADRLVSFRQSDREVSSTRPALAAARSPPVMQVRSSGRSYSLRVRSASSVGSFDAQSTAARTNLGVSASYHPPLAQPSADRRSQAEEDAGEREGETVVGGRTDVRVERPTDSGVRVGLRVHSGRVSVQPAVRSVLDTTTRSRSTASTRSLPHCSTNTTVVEQLCTVDLCSHCCRYHLLHNKSGYGRCMKSALVPWPDCDCHGKCPVVAARNSSASATASLSTLPLPSQPLTRSRQPHHAPLSHNNNINHTATTTRPECPLSRNPPLSHRLYLVCVERWRP